MTFKTLVSFLRSGQLPLLLAISRRLATPIYGATFLAAASEAGLLSCLRGGPATFDTIAASIAPGGADRDALRAWLNVGVRLGLLGHGPRDTYALRGRLAVGLSRPENDAILAALEEVVRYHQDVLLRAPHLVRSGKRLSLGDQSGELIARSTRVLEPFVMEAIDSVVPTGAQMRVLEVGCGAGGYVRHVLTRAPRSTVVAVELQSDVARAARENLKAWKLEDRAEVVEGDVRSLSLEPQFDLATLHNNIYYFRPGERVRALAHVRQMLAPGGRLLLTTACAGGNVGLDVLNLWFTLSESGGPLPSRETMMADLRAAGYRDIAARSLIPGERYYAFVGVNGRATAGDTAFDTSSSERVAA